MALSMFNVRAQGAKGKQTPASAVVTPHTSEVATTTPAEHRTDANPKRFSFRAMGFVNDDKTPILTSTKLHKEEHRAKDAAKHEQLAHAGMNVFARRADAKAQKNAVAVQKLIVGPESIGHSERKAPPVSKAQLVKIKSELMQPKAANRLIAKLRNLPTETDSNEGDAADSLKATEAPSESVSPTEKEKETAAAAAVGKYKDKLSTTAVPLSSKKASSQCKSGPIHAVCLDAPESIIHTNTFSKLPTSSISSASPTSLTALFSSLHIIDLLTAPNLGLGSPGDASGLLAGAVPTAETIIKGAEKLTPELMNLGYATGKALTPSHLNVHPPIDRLSVLTYWWGLELCLPPPTLAHLAQVPSISHELINFLSALALMNEGVREVLPFVRYMGQFVDFEWGEIKGVDEGRGVVCAATWIMPAALVPRPWDFEDEDAKANTADCTGKNKTTGQRQLQGQDTSKPKAALTGDKTNKTEGAKPISDKPELPHPPAISPLPSLLVTPPSEIRYTPKKANTPTPSQSAVAVAASVAA